MTKTQLFPGINEVLWYKDSATGATDNCIVHFEFGGLKLDIFRNKFNSHSDSELRKFFFVDSWSSIMYNKLNIENFTYEKLVEFGFFEEDVKKYRGKIAMNNLNLL